MMDLDERIRAADPARGAEVPEPRWDHPRMVRPAVGDVAAETFPRRGRPASGRAGRPFPIGGRPWLAIGAVAVVVGVLAAVLVAVAPGPAGPRSAAAAVLEEAAAAAGQQPAPQPGQYQYTETQTELELALRQPGPGGTATVATATEGQTVAAWTAPTGTTHQDLTVGTAQYPSPADQATWAADWTDRFPWSTGALTSALRASRTVPVMDVSGLPTDPSALAALIAAQKLPVPSDRTSGGGVAEGLDEYKLDDGYPYSVFEGAAVLLVGPTSGMTPALASALFQVMAAQPGVQLLGTVTDHDGQSGEGIALPTASSTQVDEVVVDPSTGQLLEAGFSPVPATIPTGDSCVGTAKVTTTTCAPHTGTMMGTSALWVDVVAHGVVGSPTATVPASGTLVPTATLAPSTPTGVAGSPLPADSQDPTGTIHLSWQAPVDAGGSPVVDYVVRETHTADGQLETSIRDTGSDATTFTWDWPEPEATFTVEAVNGDAYGPPSAPSAPVADPASRVP